MLTSCFWLRACGDAVFGVARVGKLAHLDQGEFKAKLLYDVLHARSDRRQFMPNNLYSKQYDAVVCVIAKLNNGSVHRPEFLSG